MQRLSHLVAGTLLLVVAAAPRAATLVPNHSAASISGTVVDETTSAPVRHAVVNAQMLGFPFSSQINTDDEGRFALLDLPPGRYDVSVSAPKYLQISYGASKPGMPGVAVDLKDGDQIADVVLRLARGAVIAGILSSASGDPIPNVEVRLWLWGIAQATGERALVPSTVYGVDTDDRGAYRMIGVPPGEYFVATSLKTTLGGFTTRPKAEQTPLIAHADVEALKRSAGSAGTTASSRAGVTGIASPPTIALPTFYPGAIRVSDAKPIVVAAGEERNDVDFSARAVPVARVQGTVVASASVKIERTIVQLLPGAAESPVAPGALPVAVRMVDATTFVADVVPPGEYIISARAVVARPDGGSTGETWSATLPVTVNGSDVSNLVLVPAPGRTVSGRVQFAGAARDSALSRGLMVGLRPMLTEGEVSVGGAPQAVDASGRFALRGVTRGRYLVEISWADESDRPGWTLESAVVAGRDVVDRPIDIGESDVADVLLTLTARRTVLSGTVVSASGEVARSHWVVAFPVDSALWFPSSRRIVGAAPSMWGTFSFSGLPPGDYLVAPVESIESGQWYDPALLHRLAPNALRVSLAAGEQKSVELRIK